MAKRGRQEVHLFSLERDHRRGVNDLRLIRFIELPCQLQRSDIVEHLLKVRLDMLRVRRANDREKLIVRDEVEAREQLSFAIEILVEILLDLLEEHQNGLEFIEAARLNARVFDQGVARCFSKRERGEDAEREDDDRLFTQHDLSIQFIGGVESLGLVGEL